MGEPASETDPAALQALEERLERATRAAERLLAEAAEQHGDDGPTEPAGPPTDAAADGDPGAVPPRGWQRREWAGPGPDPLGGWIDPDDARLLLTLLSELRDRVPPELERRIVVALRELLLALRALLDWCVERAERRSTPPVEVQDIPIL